MTEAIHPHGDYHTKPGLEVLRLKVEDREDGRRMVHSVTAGTGDQMVSGVGVLLADYVTQVCAQHGGNPALELLGMLAAIQNQAAAVLAQREGSAT